MSADAPQAISLPERDEAELTRREAGAGDADGEGQ